MAEVVIKIGKLLTLKNAVSELMNLEMPIVPSYKAAKIFKCINEELVTIENKRRDLVKKYGEPVEGSDTGDIRVKQESMEDFNKEFKELTDIDVTLNVDIIRISEFGDKVTLSPRILVELEDFIREN